MALVERLLLRIISGAALGIAQHIEGVADLGRLALGIDAADAVGMIFLHQRLVGGLDHRRIGIRKDLEEDIEAVTVAHWLSGDVTPAVPGRVQQMRRPSASAPDQGAGSSTGAGRANRPGAKRQRRSSKVGISIVFQMSRTPSIYWRSRASGGQIS